MAEFEYFAGMIAVILALGVTHILGQIGRIAQESTVASLYWVHAFWVGLVLLSHFAAWWNIWQLRDALQFSYPGFLYILVGPTALYLAARVLVPRLHPGSIDLERHYYRVRRTFFTLMMIFLIWPILLGLIFNSATSLMGVLQHLVLLVPIGACAVSPSRRLHAGVSILGMTVFATIAATAMR